MVVLLTALMLRTPAETAATASDRPPASTADKVSLRIQSIITHTDYCPCTEVIVIPFQTVFALLGALSFHIQSSFGSCPSKASIQCASRVLFSIPSSSPPHVCRSVQSRLRKVVGRVLSKPFGVIDEEQQSEVQSKMQKRVESSPTMFRRDSRSHGLQCIHFRFELLDCPFGCFHSTS